jgi:hypothetical protein
MFIVLVNRSPRRGRRDIADCEESARAPRRVRSCGRRKEITSPVWQSLAIHASRRRGRCGVPSVGSSSACPSVRVETELAKFLTAWHATGERLSARSRYGVAQRHSVVLALPVCGRGALRVPTGGASALAGQRRSCTAGAVPAAVVPQRQSALVAGAELAGDAVTLEFGELW